jgi:hypothetical protein
MGLMAQDMAGAHFSRHVRTLNADVASAAEGSSFHCEELLDLAGLGDADDDDEEEEEKEKARERERRRKEFADAAELWRQRERDREKAKEREREKGKGRKHGGVVEKVKKESRFAERGKRPSSLLHITLLKETEKDKEEKQRSRERKLDEREIQEVEVKDSEKEKEKEEESGGKVNLEEKEKAEAAEELSGSRRESESDVRGRGKGSDEPKESAEESSTKSERGTADEKGNMLSDDCVVPPEENHDVMHPSNTDPAIRKRSYTDMKGKMKDIERDKGRQREYVSERARSHTQRERDMQEQEQEQEQFGTFVVKLRVDPEEKQGKEEENEGEEEGEGEGGAFGTFVVHKPEKKKAEKPRPKSVPASEVYGTFVVSDAADPDEHTEEKEREEEAKSKTQSRNITPPTKAPEKDRGGLAYRQPEKWESAILALQKGIWDDSCDNEAFKRYKKTRKHLTDMSWKTVTPRQNLSKLEWGLEEGESLILQVMNVRLFLMGAAKKTENGDESLVIDESERIQTFVSGCLAVTTRNLKHYSAGLSIVFPLQIPLFDAFLFRNSVFSAAYEVFPHRRHRTGAAVSPRDGEVYVCLSVGLQHCKLKLKLKLKHKQQR